MANRRKDVPAGWTWRDGKPRWIPSPTLRKAGWRGTDLKDGKDQWLGQGASIDAARAIVDAVHAWRAGEAVDVSHAVVAPDGATAPRPDGAAPDPFAIGALLTGYLESNELRTRKNGEARPKSTRDDYRRKLKRLVDTLAGYAELPDPADLLAMEAYELAVAEVRAMSVFVLEPTETKGGLIDPLHKAYWNLHEKAGVHMAFGVLACASAWLAWCHRRVSRRIINWADDVDRETPPGRLRPWSFAELAAMVAAADRLAQQALARADEQARLCYLATADAFILAIDLVWSEAEVLQLTWGNIGKANGRRIAQGARVKTGRVGGTPFLSMGLRRLATIRRRQKAMAAQPIQVIYLPRKRRHAQLTLQAQCDYMRDWFEEIRAEAAKALPSCASITFADTRDTGFTLSRRAGLTDAGIASRSRQSLDNIKTLSDRNYGEIGPEISGPAADQLDAYLEGELRKHGVKL